VLNEASASALRDVIASEGISEQQREARMAEVRERRMQELLYAITVLASNSGEDLQAGGGLGDGAGWAGLVQLLLLSASRSQQVTKYSVLV
jgi:hypothetical protein